MSEHVAIPGDLPGLLQRWSPVLCRWPGPMLRAGVITRLIPTAPMVEVTFCVDYGVTAHPFSPSALWLPLRDRAGQARAAQWVLERMTGGSTAERHILAQALLGRLCHPSDLRALRALALRLRGVDRV